MPLSKLRRRLRDRDGLRSTLHTLILTPLKINTQFICGFGCTLLNTAQVIIDHFLTHNRPLKMTSEVGNLLLKLDVLFNSIEKLILERITHYA
jgi:hypothetical protein